MGKVGTFPIGTPLARVTDFLNNTTPLGKITFRGLTYCAAWGVGSLIVHCAKQLNSGAANEIGTFYGNQVVFELVGKPFVGLIELIVINQLFAVYNDLKSTHFPPTPTR